MYLLASAPNTMTRSPAASFPERRKRSSATQTAALPRLPSVDASQTTREDGTFSVHRMEQAILRSRVPNDSIPKWVEHTRAILYKYAPSETAESPRTWPIWDGIRPHAETLVALSIVDRRVKPHLDLMASLANLYFGKGLYSLSLTLEENLLNIAKRTHGEESTPVANRLLAYGESLRVLERNEDAERAFQRSLLIREKIDGPNSPRVGVVLNYLALAYATLGKNKEAESSYRRAIKICEDQGAKVNKEDFSKALNNLAVLLSEQEADDEAEQLLTKAVKLASDDTKKQFKPQTAIICITQLASLHVKKGNTSAAETLFRQALDRVSVFPTGHPFHEEVIERFAKFLRDTHRLTEARRLFSLLATTERARWGTDDSKKLPERRIRKKLRICEACFDVTWGSSIDSQDLGAQSDLLAEMSASAWKPWHPLNIQGIQVLDTKNLQFHFTFLTATDAEGSMTKQRQFRLLMDYFLSAIAVSEDDQWASADGRMAAELRGTALGFELLEQSKRLYRFIAAAVHTGTPSGDAFRKDLERQFGQPHATWPSVVLEVWIAPSKQSVYTGEKLTGILSRFAGSEKAGAEARAFVIKASLCVCYTDEINPKTCRNIDEILAFTIDNIVLRSRQDLTHINVFTVERPRAVSHGG